ncbi:RNase P subunit p30 family protein [Halanaeroarchaeum sulfurireducens]|uniref:Ribonuclease P protein component 3 n=1 Tax=Halanaeroarchaeum sulfurireducens TaxID=1604004 RepID=A0A0F7PA91_9EURY|nr:RNase P subunit p30 family protein [Halanaeroarchaeum sulfurireducens]AKH98076.1 ribonuclease P protein subunit RPP30 [Halanaeroarchaeum sulfurireducens]ALG82470.1 ribonuclease P protein subunit RPP30 [Halanaeroarchaeum sulfurireducens]
MYDAVRIHANGRTTTARFVSTAAEAGFDGVVVANSHENGADVDVPHIRSEYGIDIVGGVEVATTDKGVASTAIADRRPKTAVLMVRGGTPTMNRYAVETPAVDVLRDPMAGDGDVNHVLVKAAVRNDVRIEVNLGRVLRASGGPRVQALRGLRKLRDLLEYYDAPLVVTADPKTHLQVRGPRELLAVGDRIGFDEETIRRGLTEWQRIAETNREKLSPEYVAKGVRRGRDEK